MLFVLKVEQLLDFVSWPAEVAPALVSDDLGGAERLIEPRFDEYPVASGGPPEPCGEWFLVSEREALDRAKLGCEELRIAAPDPKHNKRTGVANDSRADRVAELIRVLVRECEMRCEFAGLKERARHPSRTSCAGQLAKFSPAGRGR